MRQIPKTRIGRIQKRIRRAFIESNGAPLLSAHLLASCYPRLDCYRPWHYKSVYRAASKFAVRISRPGRAVAIWGPNRELAERLAEDASAEHD